VRPFGPVKVKTLPVLVSKVFTTTYEYDSFGNKTKSTITGSGIVSRSTSVEYSTDGKFGISGVGDVFLLYGGVNQYARFLGLFAMQGNPTNSLESYNANCHNICCLRFIKSTSCFISVCLLAMTLCQLVKAIDDFNGKFGISGVGDVFFLYGGVLSRQWQTLKTHQTDGGFAFA
jgi:hypothetical protein